MYGFKEGSNQILGAHKESECLMRREKLDREKRKVIIFCASILSLPFANRRDRV